MGLRVIEHQNGIFAQLIVLCAEYFNKLLKEMAEGDLSPGPFDDSEPVLTAHRHGRDEVSNEDTFKAKDLFFVVFFFVLK